MSIVLFLIFIFKILCNKLEIYIDKYYIEEDEDYDDIEEKYIFFNSLDKAKETLEKLIRVNEETSNITFSEKFNNSVINFGFLKRCMNNTLLES